MTPSFNLWFEPWITVEKEGGAQEEVSIRDVLLRAQEYRTLYEPSPLIVVAIQRLLVAILQDALRPQKTADLKQLWRAGGFPAAAIEQFGEEYGGRFDIFSADRPFLQSADLPLAPDKKSNVKSVGYLIQEQPAGTAVTHYNHLYDDRQQFCPICAAKGLLLIPPFASSGGAGIKPSINGVPPIYVLPGGPSYFASLTASLVTPDYQPEAAAKEDTPWWRHEPIVGAKQELMRVGYLHSLTFPTRRVRLHPRRTDQPCSRCGRLATWNVVSMIYEMGESRAKDAPFWQDPFVAYRVSGGESPLPLRPQEGKAIWREFSGLFLPSEKDDPPDKKIVYWRPNIFAQLDDLREVLPSEHRRYPFRTIGLRTDMKMKIFEWEEAGFDVPTRVLFGLEEAQAIREAMEFASQGDRILKGMYGRYFSGSPSSSTPFGVVKGSMAIRAHMVHRYWQQLGDNFRLWIARFTAEADLDTLAADWRRTVVRVGNDVFRETADLLNNGLAGALTCEQAINHCRATLNSHRKKKETTDDEG